MRTLRVKKPGGLDHLELNDTNAAEPGPGEIRVRWRASSLNYHDLLVANGGLSVDDGRIPMSDGAGEVDALGVGVSRWAVGDRVMSLFFPNWQEGRHRPEYTRAVTGDSIDGCACEYGVLPENAVTRMPKGLSFAEAATLPCAGLTAWQALMVRGQMQAGDSLLVQGSGGVSVAALQIAKAAGVSVIATTSSNEKGERLKELGADHVINYADDQNWSDTVNKISGGGVDHVIDIGGGSTLKDSINAARTSGHISLVGILGGVSAKIVVPMIFAKQLEIHGVAVGNAAMQDDMTSAFEAGQIKPVIDRDFDLADTAEAFSLQTSARHFGKITLSI
jgi:NADPH:quinone reductase-like Zn-dependent oxidoreductase